MENQLIDTIYYSATSTDLTTGDITVIQAQFYAPFLDYFLVFTVLSFTIFFVWFGKVMLYPKKEKTINKISVKNY
jgi:hypothetical protein